MHKLHIPCLLVVQHDTFFAASLTTPEDTLMSQQAIQAFASYLGDQGFSTSLVSFQVYLPFHNTTNLTCQSGLVCRN